MMVTSTKSVNRRKMFYLIDTLFLETVSPIPLLRQAESARVRPNLLLE